MEKDGHGQTAEMEATPSVGTRREMTPEEWTAALKFAEAAYAEALRYHAMSEEDVVEEYRRAGKLHRYDPDKEWQKRYARAARACTPPKSVAPHLDEYLKYLEEDEADEDPALSAA